MFNLRECLSVNPRIVRANETQTVTVRPRYNFISFEGEYRCAVLP